MIVKNKQLHPNNVKILQITHSFLPNIGGLEFYVYRLTRDLKNQTLIIAPKPKHNFRKLPSVNVRYLKSKNLLPRNPMIFGIEKEIRKFKPDIVHLHSIWFIPSLQAIRFKKKCGFKVVNTVHGVYPDQASALVKIFTFLFKPMAQYVLKHSDHIIALTPKEKEKLVKIFGTSDKKISVVGNGVDEIKSDTKSKDNIRKKVSGRFILFTGRIIPDKNPEILIKAFDKIAKKHQEYKVVFVGPVTEEYKKQLLKVSQNPQRLIFYGSIDPVFDAKEMAGLYEISDISIAVGSWEGLPTRVLESMIQGTPAIVYSSGGSIDLIKDGINSYLIDELSPDKIAKKLNQFFALTDQEKRQMGTNARREIDKYRWSQKVSAIEKIYKQL
jgi:glycosyltransferase involved in cell wall biosynthesis